MKHRIAVFILSFGFVLLLTGCSLRDIYIAPDTPASVPAAPEDSVSHTLLLIGDAGEASAVTPEATLRVLTQMASERPQRTTILFLGDNLYPQGLPDAADPQRKEMERRLDEQIRAGTASGALTLFIPGNHDWEYHRPGGWDAVRRQGEYLRAQQQQNIVMVPENGQPGPHVTDIGGDLRVIALDTQWWLHAFGKPLYPGDTDQMQSRRRITDSLHQLLRTAGSRRVIVAAHHPLCTYGEHGGFFDWKDHLFPLRKLHPALWLPLPGLGSLYPLSRMFGISDQDLSGSENKAMVRAIDSVLSYHPRAIYVSGHDHTLQVLRSHEERYFVVSGNGVEKHDESLTYGEETMIATREKGFIRLQLLNNGKVRLGVISSAAGGREAAAVELP
ncbi:MAG: metallophosphoesterase [Bacteroidetes bacterium]|nr:metallophosphoesterase [Bacteroidota bacterium]